MNNAFKNLGDFIGGLTGLLMSLIGLAIIAEIAGLGFLPDGGVIGSIQGYVSDFANGGFAGLVTLLVILGLAKMK
ncbi:MAG: hypothetical protein CMD23_03890 [Flavobacteriales bacterium]|nr:hypothetical protein [Flavobacteriales bacterium]|tara:strand:+ start:372 stop:596 length:225 start_codon:yes stop_codon:yes gene_type:complete